jgi:predicted ATPase/predicted Ser/Thr protein kinase
MVFQAAPGMEIAGYLIVSVVGRGGTATVWLADHPGLGRRVALKILASDLAEDAAFRERFTQEAHVAAALEHPNVLPIYDAGEWEGLLFIAMRYVDGTDLGSVLKREGVLTLNRTLQILSQVAAALDAAHAKGLVHRDVKPQNILIDPGAGPGGTDHTYLADFGLARPSLGTSLLSKAGELYGTIDYMAPEQLSGGIVDARTDTYAFSCLAYECLTGAPPFRRETLLATAAAHLHDELVPPSNVRPELPVALDEVLAKGLAKDKGSRVKSAGEMVAQLQEVSVVERAEGRATTGSDVRRLATYGGQGKLPTFLTSFVGRSRELRSLELRLQTNRVVTVFGMAGIGKSRFAVEFGGTRWKEGVFYVDLASSHGADSMVVALADAFGGERSTDVIRAIGENLIAQTLLILDNCEEVREFSRPVLRELLGSSSIRILATSREPIGLLGEASFPLPPMETPDPESNAPENVESSESGRVFVQIARAARPSFRLGPTNAKAVAQICDQLGGLPFAVELVAASVQGLSAQAIAARLTQPGNDWTQSLGRGDNPRYGSVWAALEWSWGLLEPEEAELLKRLAVFEGSFSLDSAEVICATEAVPSADISVPLASLVGRSLVLVEGAEDAFRYRLLSPVRQWLNEQHSLPHGEQDSVEGRHSAYFLNLAASAGASLARRDHVSFVQELQFDTANLTKALRSSVVELTESRPNSRREAARATGARLAFALGKWEVVEELLGPVADTVDPELTKLLGIALCKSHANEPSSEIFKRGQQLLQVQASAPEADPEAMVALARSWRGVDDNRARKLYRQALDLDPSDPYALGNYLEIQLATTGDVGVIEELSREVKLSALRCQDEIDRGANLPWAAFDLGKFALLRDEFEECYRAYAVAISKSMAPFMIETSLRSVEQIGRHLSRSATCRNAQEMLTLGLISRYPTSPFARERKRHLKTRNEPAMTPPVLIVAGASASGDDPSFDESALVDALGNGSGTLVAGGTAQGVSAMAAAAAVQVSTWKLIGYAPEAIPQHVSLDERYVDLRQTDGLDFGPSEPLAYWKDILLSDIDPTEVTLLGIGGGTISAFEFRLALCLGARVRVVLGSGGAAEQLLVDPSWRDSSLLRVLDPDLDGLLVDP